MVELAPADDDVAGYFLTFFHKHCHHGGSWKMMIVVGGCRSKHILVWLLYIYSLYTSWWFQSKYRTSFLCATPLHEQQKTMRPCRVRELTELLLLAVVSIWSEESVTKFQADDVTRVSIVSLASRFEKDTAVRCYYISETSDSPRQRVDWILSRCFENTLPAASRKNLWYEVAVRFAFNVIEQIIRRPNKLFRIVIVFSIRPFLCSLAFLWSSVSATSLISLCWRPLFSWLSISVGCWNHIPNDFILYNTSQDT